MGGYEVRVDAWSGNVRPWQARIYRDGVFLKKTGYYATERAAHSAGERAIEQIKQRIAKGSDRG